MGTAISDVGAVLGTGLVAQALNEFVEHSLGLKVKFIAGRSAAIVQGTNDALMAYVQADGVMAQQGPGLSHRGPVTARPKTARS